MPVRARQMSTNRRYRTWSVPQGQLADGTRLCIQCQDPITAPRRRTFCSNECYEAFRLRSNPGYARQKVFERDHGVCAECSIDTVAELMKLRPARYRNKARGTGHLWQADHIVPVVEGGGECDLSNLQSLCNSCHRDKTVELNKRRAAQRKLKQ